MQGPGYMFEFAPTLYKIYSEQVGITSVYGGDHSGWWLSIQLKKRQLAVLIGSLMYMRNIKSLIAIFTMLISEREGRLWIQTSNQQSY